MMPPVVLLVVLLVVAPAEFLILMTLSLAMVSP